MAVSISVGHHQMKAFGGEDETNLVLDHFSSSMLILLHLNRGARCAFGSSQAQVTIDQTGEDFSLQISLTLLPNKEGQLSVWLLVKSDQNKVNAEGWIERGMDGLMADRKAFRSGLRWASVFACLVIVLVVYQVALLRHGCQDLTAERRRQSADTDSSG